MSNIKRFTKRGLSVFLALVMCSSLLPTAAFAVGTDTQDEDIFAGIIGAIDEDGNEIIDEDAEEVPEDVSEAIGDFVDAVNSWYEDAQGFMAKAEAGELSDEEYEAEFARIQQSMEEASELLFNIPEEYQDREEVLYACQVLNGEAEPMKLLTGEEFRIQVNIGYLDGNLFVRTGSKTMVSTCRYGCGHAGYNHTMDASQIVSDAGYAGASFRVTRYGYWDNPASTTNCNYNITGSAPYKADQAIWILGDKPVIDTEEPTPGGGNVGGGSGSETINDGGKYSWTQKIIYHANYPDGTDPKKTITYNINALSQGRSFNLKSYGDCDFKCPDGYNVSTWYKGNQGNAVSNYYSSRTSHADVHFYARYTPIVTELPKNTFALTYNANGGKVEGKDSHTVSIETTDTSYNFNSLEPVWDGYKFLGWYTDRTNGTEVKWPVTLNTTNATKTVYAHWEALPDTHENATVTYKPGAGTGTDVTETVPGSQDYTIKSVSAVLFTAPTGKVFSHWEYQNAKKDVYFGGDKFTPVDGSANVFVAIWKDDDSQTGNATYTVSWYDQDGKEIKAPETRRASLNSPVSVTEADKIVKGYTFDENNSGNLESAVLDKSSGIELKLYFTKNPGPTMVEDTFSVQAAFKGLENERNDIPSNYELRYTITNEKYPDWSASGVLKPSDENCRETTNGDCPAYLWENIQVSVPKDCGDCTITYTEVNAGVSGYACGFSCNDPNTALTKAQGVGHINTGNEPTSDTYKWDRTNATHHTQNIFTAYAIPQVAVHTYYDKLENRQPADQKGTNTVTDKALYSGTAAWKSVRETAYTTYDGKTYIRVEQPASDATISLDTVPLQHKYVRAITVTWLKEDGTQIKQETIPNGEDYKDLYPNDPSDTGKWDDPKIDDKDNITIQWKEDSPPTPETVTITVKFVDENGNIVKSETVDANKGSEYDVTEKATTVPGGYDKIVKTEGDPAKGNADSNKTIIVTVGKETPPESEKVTITIEFKDEDGNVVKTETVDVNKDSEYDVTEKVTTVPEGYDKIVKTEGDPAKGNADSNKTITVTVGKDTTPAPELVTVTWLNGYNDTAIKVKNDHVKGAAVPQSEYPADPTRSSYTFTGWGNPVTDAATGNITITAQWRSTGGGGSGNGGGGGGGSTNIPDNPTPLDPGTQITDPDVPLAVAPGLNSTDHFAYIIGYPDGTVRPQGNITRAEVATIFFRLMTDEFRTTNWASTNSFPDVASASLWYNNAVSTAAKAGLLKGKEDGNFHPSQNITRAEFATIAARFLSDEEITAQPFPDTVGHWAEKDIIRAVQAGWIKGDSDGNFRPNDPITRAEAMTLVNRMLDRVPDKDHMLSDMVTWPDNPESAWFYEAVQEATNSHDYERDELGVTETWTGKLADRDWSALEKEWSDAASSTGSDVADNLQK